MQSAADVLGWGLDCGWIFVTRLSPCIGSTCQALPMHEQTGVGKEEGDSKSGPSFCTLVLDLSGALGYYFSLFLISSLNLS